MGEDFRVLKLLNALTISESNLTVDQLASLRDLVVEYSDVFALDMSELGLTDLVSHTINTGDNSLYGNQSDKFYLLYVRKWS